VSAGLYAVVVTGSRDWADKLAVEKVLVECLRESFEDLSPVQALLVIHGDCPTGADAQAHAWAEYMGSAASLPMPAQWDRDKKQAGPIRNSNIGAVANCLRTCGWTVSCHAFGLAQSKGGTKDCVEKLTNYGFRVTEHEASE